MGTRALLIEGESPYSEAVAEDIRMAIQEHGTENPNFTRVTFPLYSIIFYLPFALIADSMLAQALWMIALEIGLFLLALACLRLTRWRMNAWNLPLYAVFVITWFHSLIVLHEGSVVVLVALLLAWCFLAIRNGQDELGGILLALSTIRPVLVLLPLAFILLWASAHRRWKLVIWFAGSLVVLVFLGMFFLQGWLLQSIQAAFASLDPLYPMTPGAAFSLWWPGIGSRLGWILSALLGVILLVEWWIAIRVKEFRWFLWTASLTLVLGQWIGIRTEPANYLLLLIPLTLVFAVWDERWKRGEHRGRAIASTVISMALLEGLPWAIFLGSANLGQAFQETVLQEMPLLLFPLPLFLLITLFWVRWWAVRPQSLYVEALREEEAA
jgi:hypothetical protein